MIDVLAALLPPAVVATAFVAIVLAVKRLADAEQQGEDAYLDAQEKQAAEPDEPPSEPPRQR